ncbi:DUF6056 family protein [Loigolactobacillus rennini]|uniref:Glucosyltransferase (Side chain biosynthesis) n=1 Tax=Loigolactobacillus rennini TaxID=238013 RepID=A0A1K2IBM4_9LACO|nr:DUF6056 family protein [Loigolactobacillus rennini]SFZ89097.1 Glucosyltransferase (side chain biosynthesis) [Loigolactobacillus rennini]
MQRKRINWQNLLIIGALLLLLFIYLSRFGFNPLTDDGIYKSKMGSISINKYVISRYTTWSARILPDFVLYYIFHLPVAIFHLLNLGFITLLSFALLRITQQPITWQRMCLFPLLLGYVNFSVIQNGFLWLTGSANYLWPAALGACALIPFADSYFKDKTSKHDWFFLIPGLLFSLSNEQFIASAVGIGLIYIATMFWQHRKPAWIPSLNTLFFIIGSAVMYLAPGNAVRMEAEIKNRFPDFNQLSLLSHFRIGISWLFTAISQNFLWLLVLLAILAFALLKNNQTRVIFSLGYLISLAGYLVQPEIFTNFNFINKVILTASIKNFVQGITVYALFSLFLILLLWNMMLVVDQPIFLLLCCLAALLSSMIMWFSPTIYASGTRVLVCPAIFLLVVALVLLKQVLHQYSNKTTWIFQLLLVLPLFNYFTHLF